MILSVPPLQIAVTAAAAGLATHAWWRRRGLTHAATVSDMDARLRGFYRTVELRAAPTELLDLVDRLEGSWPWQGG